MIVKKLNYLRIEERGKELKVPHHANAAAVRDGNLPYIKTTCLYSQHKQKENIIILPKFKKIYIKA